MALVSAYLRPTTVDEALNLLARPGTVALGGGTKVNAARAADPVVVVDLQALGLDHIARTHGGTLAIGATATLQHVADSPAVPGAVREAARREQPSTLRNQATIGGCVATGAPDSELLATLLVHEAVVTLAGAGPPRDVPLQEVLAELPLPSATIITAVTINTSGRTASAHTARTAADRPIVAAVARRTAGGQWRLALTGVAARPVLAHLTDDLDPPGDFRGSGEYRRALAAVLTARALDAFAAGEAGAARAPGAAGPRSTKVTRLWRSPWNSTA